jgi:DNA-directed RNA polymerase subunit K/omega
MSRTLRGRGGAIANTHLSIKSIETAKKIQTSKTVSFDIEIDESIVITEDEYVYTKKARKTLPYMSQYELSALILARMAQLSSPAGSPLIPMSEIDNFDPLVIATKEVYARLPSLVIRRTLSDGSTEDWLLTDKNEPLEFPRL